jgi:O-antigen/teichoic acid export membrane protein
VKVDEIPHSLRGTILRGASLAGTGFVLTQALYFGFYLLLARVATPEDFGQFAAGAILITVGLIVADTGMGVAVIQRRDRVEEAASTAFVSTLGAGVALSLLALALAPVIGFVFQSHDIGLVAAAMAGTVPLSSAISIPNALMQRRFSFVRRIVTDPLGAIAFGITAATACSQGMGVWGLVLGTYAGAVIELGASWVLVQWRPKLRLVSVEMWRELIHFSRPILASELVIRGGTVLETFLLGRFVSAPALGQYRYAYRLAALPLATLVNVASFVLLPAFARIAPDETRFQMGLLRTVRWVAIVALPASLALFPLGEPLAVVLLGEEWRDAGYALMGLCAYSAGHSLASIASETFKAVGRPDLLPRMHLISFVLVAAFMLLLLRFELVGIAVAVSLGSIGMAAYAVHGIVRATGLRARSVLEQIWPPAAAAVFMAVSIYLVERLLVDAESHGTGVGLVLLALEIGLSAAAYVAALRLVAPSMVADLLEIARTGWRRLRRPAVVVPLK